MNQIANFSSVQAAKCAVWEQVCPNPDTSYWGPASPFGFYAMYKLYNYDFVPEGEILRAGYLTQTFLFTKQIITSLAEVLGRRCPPLQNYVFTPLSLARHLPATIIRKFGTISQSTSASFPRTHRYALAPAGRMLEFCTTNIFGVVMGAVGLLAAQGAAIEHWKRNFVPQCSQYSSYIQTKIHEAEKELKIQYLLSEVLKAVDQIESMNSQEFKRMNLKKVYEGLSAQDLLHGRKVPEALIRLLYFLDPTGATGRLSVKLTNLDMDNPADRDFLFRALKEVKRDNTQTNFIDPAVRSVLNKLPQEDNLRSDFFESTREAVSDQIKVEITNIVRLFVQRQFEETVDLSGSNAIENLKDDFIVNFGKLLPQPASNETSIKSLVAHLLQTVSIFDNFPAELGNDITAFVKKVHKALEEESSALSFYQAACDLFAKVTRDEASSSNKLEQDVLQLVDSLYAQFEDNLENDRQYHSTRNLAKQQISNLADQKLKAQIESDLRSLLASAFVDKLLQSFTDESAISEEFLVQLLSVAPKGAFDDSNLVMTRLKPPFDHEGLNAYIQKLNTTEAHPAHLKTINTLLRRLDPKDGLRINVLEKVTPSSIDFKRMQSFILSLQKQYENTSEHFLLHMWMTMLKIRS